MIAGLDVGSPQGAITASEWLAIRADRAWVILRCMQGIGPGVDPTFRANLDGARAAKMKGIGAYFVFLPGVDPVAQATAWFAACGGLGTRAGELPPTVDFEVASKMLTPAEECAALVHCTRTMALLWSREPVIYSYPDFEKRDILAVATPDELALLAACSLWFASYETLPPAPPRPWTKVTFWQSSGGNKYKTPAGLPCDADFFLGDEAELEELASFIAGAGPNPLAGDTSTLMIPGGGGPDDPIEEPST